MSAVLTPDLCVVGAGSAGLTVAAAARAVGFSVVLIERGEMGGECLNSGCVPSKALIAAARHAHAIRRAERFGIRTGDIRIDPEAVRAHIRRTIATIAPHDSQARFEGLGATVIRAPARFLDARTITAGDRLIRAKRIVLATGSRPALPPIAGLDGVDALTNESLFDLDRLPEHLAIVGAGAVSLEMAQAFRRLGSRVTVLARGAILGREDPDCAALAIRRIEAEGVVFLRGRQAVAVERTGSGVRLHLDGPGQPQELAASHLLIAAGRRPATEGLDLAAGGIAQDGAGITVDDRLRTSNPRVQAIGDVASADRFTHWAGHQGGLVVRSMLSPLPVRLNRDRLVRAIYTDPEIAHVGLDEAEARRRQGGRVRVLAADYAGNDRAVAEDEAEGVLKLIVGRGDRILGASIAGPAAGETAGMIALAIAGRLGIGAFAGAVLPYPTLAETARRAALSGYAQKLERPAVKAALGLMRRLLR